MKKPVSSLAIGDFFRARDEAVWQVVKLTPPDNYTTLPQIGEKTGAFTILAAKGNTRRKFWYHGAFLVEVR